MGRKYGTALSQVGLELKKFQKQKLKNGQNLRNNYKLFKLTQYILLNKNITFCSYLDFWHSNVMVTKIKFAQRSTKLI